MSEEQKKASRSVLFLTFGIVLILLFGGALFSMEKYSAAQRDALTEAQSTAIAMTDTSKIDAALDGKLISAQGKITTTETIKDSLFGLEIDGLGLVYSVSYYQVIHTGEDDKIEWTTRAEKYNDNDVDAVNTVILRNVNNGISYVSKAALGAYSLDTELLQSLVKASAFKQNFTPEQLETIHEQILDDAKKSRNAADSVEAYLAAQKAGESPSILAKIMYDELYLGFDPKKPRLGDMRVTFYTIPVQEASLIATVKGNTLQAYKDARGKDIPLIYPGKLSSEEILQKRIEESFDNIWMLRAIFALFIILGGRAVISYLSRAEVTNKDEDGVSYATIFSGENAPQESSDDYMQRVYGSPWISSITFGLVVALLVSFAGRMII